MAEVDINILTNNNENKYDCTITTTKKLNANKWGMIDKPLTETEIKRNEIILKLGEDSSLITNELSKTNIHMIGDYYYNIAKKELKNIVSFNDDIEKTEINISKNKSEKKKELKLNSSMKLKLNTTLDSVNKKIVILKKILEDKPENKLFSDLLANTNYIEFRIIILMYIIDYYKNQRTLNISEIEEILLGSKKILNLLKNIKINKNNEYSNYFKKICQIDGFEISLSEIMINDLENKINGLINKCNIKLIDIANTRPKLIYDTKYDEIISNIKLKPYESQEALAKLVKNNITNGFLIFYKTLPGLGKTSMILSICSYIRKSNTDLKVIFCCSDLLEAVRVQVCRTVFNFGIKFGIATCSKDNEKYIITNSWNCPKDNERELIVADYKSTYLILKKSNTKYLLFFDEPTVLTDEIKNSTTLNYLSLILYNLPSRVILSSATLPMISELKPITDHFSSNYPNAIVTDIISNKTLIGCFIKDFDSKMIIPHSYCKNFEEMKNLILKIKNFPLLGKFYTLPFLMNLNKFALKYDCGINLESIETFDQDNILENILELFEAIIKLDRKDIWEEFSNIKIKDIHDCALDKDRLDLEYEKVIPKKFLTTHAFKYLGCCLIATSDPMEYSKNNLFPIVDKLKDKIGIKDINKKYNFYLNDLSKYNEMIEKIKIYIRTKN